MPAGGAAGGGEGVGGNCAGLGGSAVARAVVIGIVRISPIKPAAAAGEEQASEQEPRQNGNPGFREHVALLGRANTLAIGESETAPKGAG